MTDKEALQKKAMILKLKPEDLRLWASTNLNLSELHKLKEINNKNKYITEYSYNHLALMPITSEPVVDVLSEDNIMTDENSRAVNNIALYDCDSTCAREEDLFIDNM